MFLRSSDKSSRICFACLRKLVPIFVFLGLSVLCRAALATTRNVPTQYATIQAAIDASVTGDTVLIADGTYTGLGNVDLDFGGKGITVTSQHGADVTIIDCQGSAASNHRGFNLHSGEINAVISGLTIENGYESNGKAGGGISYYYAFPRMESGAVYSELTVQDCTLKNNVAGLGGGLYDDNQNFDPNGTITVTNCLFSNNSASVGGGIYNVFTNKVTVTDCMFTGNMATNGDGGGIYNDATKLVIAACIITSNSAKGGGGIYNGSSAIITDCLFTGNIATNGNGGGIKNISSAGLTSLINCSLIGNLSSSSGGGVYNVANGGKISVSNCTLTENSAMYGGGINDDGAYAGSDTLTNDILYGDTGGEIAGTKNMTVTYCDIQGGYTGTGNINLPPKFVNATNDLHLLAGSPCLGAGTANGAPGTTIDGRQRPTPPSIGAYELDIRAVTVTSVQSNLNPSVVGRNVTFTMTVAGDDGPPTGTVNILIDGNVASTLTLSSGIALFSISSLAVGTHSVTAAYSGDTDFKPSASAILPQTVQPVAVSSVSFSPSSITGIGNLTGTLVLNTVAPAGNAIVSLSSNNPGAFYVPATAQLNAGLSSRTFTGTSRFVNVSTPVTVTATYGGVSKTTVVTIKPVIATALASLSLSPTTITGAGSVTGTLTLNGVAPANNAVVSLSSNNPNALYVPATAQLNYGVTSRTFTATSRLVTASTNVTVTATWAGGSKMAVVTVKPITATSIASISFSPSSITGTGNLTGTLALNGIAPSGNAVVHLSSSNPNALYVPATAQINAGLISRTFTATARPVTITTSVTVTAKWPGASVTTTVILHPLTMSSVSFSPSSVRGGGNITGTLTLTGSAPATNAVVQLTSSNAAIFFVPATAQIASGFNYRTFTAYSRAVTTSTNVTVMATYGGVSKTTVVTVTP